MPGQERISGEETATQSATQNLLLRVISSVVLVSAALAVTYVGGIPFALFWAAVSALVWWEWLRLVEPAEQTGVLVIGLCALGLAFALMLTGRGAFALLIVGLGALAAATMAARRPGWIGGGLMYASALLLAPVQLRDDGLNGMVAILFVFAVVWATDIAGYFGGRTIGGPKLAPAISPKKTWSGAICGSTVAVVAGLVVLWPADGGATLKIALVALMLSFVSQAGDLFESHVKRRFDAKDSSALIPGHGGVMDRIDGFVVAATVALLAGAVRGGWDMAATGLVAW